jgi:hypothetical protein
MTARTEKACDALGEVIIQTTLNALVRLREGHVETLGEQDITRLHGILKTKMREETAGLLRDLKETKEAFHGNESMLRLTLSVGCMEIAKNAWVEFARQTVG